MGYTTDFSGELTLSKPLDVLQFSYINRFSDTRRMKRDVNKLMELYKGKYGHPTPIAETPEAIYGEEGEYFAHDDGNSGQKEDPSIIEYNTPPGQLGLTTIEEFHVKWAENKKRSAEGICQPGLWCQWIVEDEEGQQYLRWDGGEKFYNYVEWLKYLIKHFFNRWGVKLNGKIQWYGEESSDMGKIVVKDNVVTIQRAVITYEDSDE